MVSSIYFNGRVTHVPGSYSEVDASGLSVVGLGAVGIVAVIGEAEGGSPYNGDVPVHRITNPAKIAKTFRDGDLKEAGNMIFDPSKDPDIPAGASQVKFVKVNPATQSSKTFQDGATDVLTLTSKEYGKFTTQINVEIADGTNQGKAITIVFEDQTETFDDIGGDPAFTAEYTPGSLGATTMTLEVDNATGVEALFTKTATGLDGDYVGTLDGLTGKDGDKDNNITASAVVNVVSSSASDVGNQVVVYGLDGSNVAQSETLTLNGTNPVVGAATWNAVHGIIKLTATVGNVTLKDNGDSDTLFVLDTPASLTAGGGVNDFAGTAIESVNSAVTVVADGASTAVVIVVGLNSSATPTLEKFTLNGTTPVAGAVVWSRIDAIALGYVAAARAVSINGQQFNYGDIVNVVSSNAGDTTQTVTVYGLDNTGAVQSEVLTLNGTSLVAGTATWRRVYGVLLSAVTLGTVTVTSMESVTGVGELTLFTWNGASSISQGLKLVDNVSVADTTVDVVADSTTTRPILLIGLDAEGQPQIEAITLTSTTPVTSSSDWSEITAIGIGHLENARTITVSGTTADLPLDDYDTVTKVADQLNALGGWEITVSATAGDLLIADLDNKGPSSVLSTEVEFTGDLAYIALVINEESQLVTADVESGATGAPDNTSGPVFLVGGTEGATSFDDWQAALDLLRNEVVSTIVVLTDDAAVHAAAVSHCNYMCGAGRKERDCVLGEESGITLTLAQAAAAALNTRHARLCIQDITRFNTDGEEEQFAPFFTAAVVAGMQAGAEVGTPLTAKYANVLDVVGDDDTYTLIDDADELITSGLLVFEEKQGVGFRVLRNVTTYLIDSNLAYTEASVNQATNYAVQNLREQLEIAVGKKGFAGTVNAALGVAIAILGQLVDNRIITDWRNLTIELDDDVMTVDVEIAPVLPVNFVKTTVHLVSSSIAVAA